MRKAQRREVLIYCIGLLSEEEPREAGRTKRALNALAEASDVCSANTPFNYIAELRREVATKILPPRSRRTLGA